MRSSQQVLPRQRRSDDAADRAYWADRRCLSSRKCQASQMAARGVLKHRARCQATQEYGRGVRDPMRRLRARESRMPSMWLTRLLRLPLPSTAALSRQPGALHPRSLCPYLVRRSQVPLRGSREEDIAFNNML